MNTEYEIIQNANYLLLKFPESMRSISSAPLGGGIGVAGGFLNLKVPYNISKEVGGFPPPEVTLRECCVSLGVDPEICVGMMTAANIETFGYAREKEENKWLDAGVTVGLGNSRRAGECADCMGVGAGGVPPAGTINISVVTNMHLSNSALVEAIALVAETKAKVIMDYGILSTKSGEAATGTGTDAIAVFSAMVGEVQHYCGKHLIAGQMLARAVDSALAEGLEKYFKIIEDKPWIRQGSC